MFAHMRLVVDLMFHNRKHVCFVGNPGYLVSMRVKEASHSTSQIKSAHTHTMYKDHTRCSDQCMYVSVAFSFVY